MERQVFSLRRIRWIQAAEKYHAVWLFANTPNGASASSLIYSVIQTAIANDLKPLFYLEYVFEQIQLEKDLQTEDLLPWSDKIPEWIVNPF